jgi:hypothetical protein
MANRLSEQDSFFDRVPILALYARVGIFGHNFRLISSFPANEEI